MKISYNWLQNYFENKLPSPEELSEGIIFHAFEVEDIEKKENDTIFDIKILPDRAHDCLSHWGIAKEVSAIFGLKIKTVEEVYSQISKLEKKEGLDSSLDSSTTLEIKIESNKCRRYMGRIVKNIKVGPSPSWLVEKLEAIGQRSINNIVDAANYVMFDLGNPIHAFDLDKLESSKIIIRNAVSGEKITTLDKKEVDLDESVLVIADTKDPLAIAGIKGGTKAEVDNNTKNIVIEVANFEAPSTRKTAKKINIQTDAVKRYENDLSPKLCEVTMKEITSLVLEIAGGMAENIVDIFPSKTEDRYVSVSVPYINKCLGTNFKKEEIIDVWNRLGFEFREKEDEFNIKVPPLRLDITGPHNLTEEVIQILGFDKLEEKIPDIKINKTLKINETFYKMLLARAKLLSLGYSEVMTYTFRDKGELEVLASASDKKFLRTNISDGLKESIKLNLLNAPLLDIPLVKVFEIGTVFFADREEVHVAYGDKKNIIEMTLDKYISKEIGEEEFPYEMPWERSEGNSSRANVFKPWSIYPFITRDIAVWVPEGIPPEELVTIYKSFGTELLIKEPKLFDSFTKPASEGKEAKTSFAYRLVFQSYDRTLTDEEINQIMSKITDKIISLGWEVR